MNTISTNGFGFTNGTVLTSLMDYSNNCIYVGGTFTSVYDSTNVNGLPANNIAIWDLSNNVWELFGNTIYNGTSNTVNALALDSSNNQLYVGGAFFNVRSSNNNITANYIARWDISNNIWKQLGNTYYNGTNNNVNALALDPSNMQLYVGGSFTSVQDTINIRGLTAYYAAIWDIYNNIWKQIGKGITNGTSAAVNALAFDSSNIQLYVGGTFTTASDASNVLITQYIGSYNYLTNLMSNIATSVSGYTNGTVNATVTDYSNNCIYAGGTFTIVYDASNVNGLSAKYIAKWDISNNVWRQFGNSLYNGTNGTVNSLELDSLNNQLYVGGNFSRVQDTTNIPELTAFFIARWDISNNVWKQFGNNIYNGTSGAVLAFAVDSSNNQLYVGGLFASVYDSSNTTPLSAKYIARWDISNNIWKQLGNTTYNGTNTTVRALELDSSNNQLYVGGDFTTVQDISNTTALSTNRIARWDISNNVWIQLGNKPYNGTNNPVYALELDLSNNQLYVGGNFTTVQDISNTTALSAKSIARWDISNNVWRQFGNTSFNGTNNTVVALELDLSNNQLYVGGFFTSVQDLSNTVALSANRIARWDISNNVWQRLGNASYNGTNATVNTVTWNPLTSSLYLGGSFTSINLLSLNVANRIARYDVSNNVWRQLGNNSYNGTNNTVNALALDSSNSQLYVGGAFTTAQDISNVAALSTKYVARWDISNNVWRQFGNTTYNGTNATTRSLAVDSSNNQIYVGGDFTTVQDISNTTALTVNYTARWNISNNAWNRIGNTTNNGTNGTVNTMSWNPVSTTLYVGGSFTKANYYINTKSLNNYITEWDISNNYWNPVGNILYNGTNTTVNAVELDISNNQLYVGGSFATVKDTNNTTGLSANSIAKWAI